MPTIARPCAASMFARCAIHAECSDVPVSHTTVWYLAKGRPSRRTKAQRQQYLTPSEEKAFVQHTIKSAALEFPLRIKDIPPLASSMRNCAHALISYPVRAGCSLASDILAHACYQPRLHRLGIATVPESRSDNYPTCSARRRPSIPVQGQRAAWVETRSPHEAQRGCSVLFVRCP